MPHVLVIDDDAAIQKLLQVNFEMEGFSVSTASNGADGLATIQANRPDIVLLDVMMPHMDGIELVRELKGSSATSDIPVMLLSGSAEYLSSKEDLVAVADAYFSKPFEMSEVLGRVRELLRKR